MNLDYPESLINLIAKLRSLSRCVLTYKVLCISFLYALAKAGVNLLAFVTFCVFITPLKDSIYYTRSILATLNLPC